jgi:hypothetical protein
MRRALLVGASLLICATIVAVALSVPRTEAAPVPKRSADTLAKEAVKALAEVLPPPDKPQYTGTDEEWEAAAKKVKITFPAEYKRFIQTYGFVAVNQFLIFHTPLAESEYSGLLEQIDFYRKHNQRIVVWPEEGGVLPIATTVCAHAITYRCKGKPDEWTIAVLDKGGVTVEEHPFGLVEFMSRLATGKLESKLLMYHKEMHPPLKIG